EGLRGFIARASRARLPRHAPQPRCRGRALLPHEGDRGRAELRDTRGSDRRARRRDALRGEAVDGAQASGASAPRGARDSNPERQALSRGDSRGAGGLRRPAPTARALRLLPRPSERARASLREREETSGRLRKEGADIKVQGLPSKRTVQSSTVPHVSAGQARLLLLGAQGLLADPARAATKGAVFELVRRMGFVQLDSISYVERAHHLTLGSRLHAYRREHFARLLESDRSLFEHWTHDASAVPTEWFTHWKPRFKRADVRIRANGWWQERMGGEADRHIDAVRARIAREGALRSQDFEHERGQVSAWWGWKPQKAALEYLWHTGELLVVRREKFQKVYD